MDRDTPKHEEAAPETGHPLAEAGGKGQGGNAGSTASDGFENNDTLSASSKTFHQQQQEQQSAVPGGQRPSTSPSPRASSNFPKVKVRGHRGVDHPPGQSNPTMPAVMPAGMLPPLNVRGRDGQGKETHEEHPKAGKGRVSLKSTALAVVSAGTLKAYRRSSAAMHVDLLRVFVPDMLINVSAMRTLRT